MFVPDNESESLCSLDSQQDNTAFSSSFSGFPATWAKRSKGTARTAGKQPFFLLVISVTNKNCANAFSVCFFHDFSFIQAAPLDTLSLASSYTNKWSSACSGARSVLSGTTNLRVVLVSRPFEASISLITGISVNNQCVGPYSGRFLPQPLWWERSALCCEPCWVMEKSLW